MMMTSSEIAQIADGVLEKHLSGKKGNGHNILFDVMAAERVKFREVPVLNNAFVGALTKACNDQWYLMVNREIENTGRKNFTIAHELGHYFLSHQLHSSSFFCNDTGISEETQTADLLEREANYFADCFLMPEPKITAAFKAILRNSKTARSTDFLYVSSNYRVWCGMRDSLMKRYGVSEAALRYRLVQLNLAKFDFKK